MILITGVTGNVGMPLVTRLADQGVAVRAVARHPEKIGETSGSVELFAGDVSQAESLRDAFLGVRKVFLILPGDADLGGLLRIANESGVDRVVLVSSLLAETHPDSFIGRSALAGEKLLQDSRIDWTILRPWEFASNALWWAPSIRDHGLVRTYGADATSPVIDPLDIASAGARVVSEDGHAGQTYALTGPEDTTPRGRVRALSEVLGTEIRFEEMTREQAREQMMRYMPAEIADDMTSEDSFGGGPGVKSTVEAIAGTRARTFAQWALDNIEQFR
ncbi:SDR family oxidoreductase [Parasphingorhabdus pacifica]